MPPEQTKDENKLVYSKVSANTFRRLEDKSRSIGQFFQPKPTDGERKDPLKSNVRLLNKLLLHANSTMDSFISSNQEAHLDSVSVT